MSDAPRQIGRFTLLAELGRGAQATVWRAHDPRLQREVALKCLHTTDDDATLQADWQAEARLAGGLRHPGIVPIFDVLEQDGQLAIVSECVPGQTLAARLREQGPLPPRDAAQWMRDVLDALAHAHAQGVVHRDLKASNVMLGSDARPRVMDFGIAARIGSAHDGRIVGSPSTISPEAAAGEPPSPGMDLYAAGMLLGELLTGRPLRAVRDPLQALHLARTQDVAWPADCAADIDDLMRSIVLRATARDPSRRWADAAAMRDALDAWLHPSGEPGAPARHGTLDFLLRRMRLNGDFPALSDAVLRIQRITASDSESLPSLAAEILRDVALTQRLLRLVNSAHFRHSAAGEVSTVSRAAALVGFSGIRTMALSLLLLEHMGNQAQAARMKNLFLEALLTATLVDQLTPPSREREEAFLAGVFSQLGVMLVEYYLPEEAQRIRGADGVASERAQIDVLGLSYGALAQGVAATWGLPDSLRRAMSVPPGEPPAHRVEQPSEAMRWRVRAAGELVQCLLAGDDGHQGLQRGAERFARALGHSRDELLNAVQLARGQLLALAAGLGLDGGPTVRASRLLEAPALAPPVAPDQPTLTQTDPVASQRSQQMLAAGMADVTASLASDSFVLNEVLRMILETLLRALPFDRVVLALRDPRSGLLSGRLALGEGAQAFGQRLQVDLGPGGVTDLFAAACRKGVDTLIEDGRAAKLRASLPAGVREAPPRSFLLLPLMRKGAPFALIYADRLEGVIRVNESELALLRTLRNQAVLAFKAAG